MNFRQFLIEADWNGFLDPSGFDSVEKKELYEKLDLNGPHRLVHVTGEKISWTCFSASKAAANQISKTVKKGHFAVMWNNKLVQVIFRNRIFEIENTNPFDHEVIAKITVYAREQRIPASYFHRLRELMKDRSNMGPVPYKHSRDERAEAKRSSQHSRAPMVANPS